MNKVVPWSLRQRQCRGHEGFPPDGDVPEKYHKPTGGSEIRHPIRLVPVVMYHIRQGFPEEVHEPANWTRVSMQPSFRLAH